MFISRVSKIALAISALCATSVLANETKEEEVERVSIWTTAVNASSLYLHGEEIANKQADHVSDLLRSIPGVDVGGAHSLNQRITIRSMDDKDLKISIDGAAQNTYMYHHMGNLQIHADILKAVDIEIGSNSVIDGGLGGSVRFTTKEARELLKDDSKFGGRTQVSSGSNSGTNYSVTGYGLLSDDIDVLGYFNAVDRDNYEVGGGKILDENGQTIEGTDGTVRGLKGELFDSLVKFGWNIDENQRLSFGYESYSDKGDYSFRPDMGLATDLAITNNLQVPLLWPTKFTRDTATLKYDLSWGESQLTASIFSNTSELYRNEMGWAENPAYAAWASRVRGEATNSGINVLAETAFDGENINQELTYGLDYIRHETSYRARGMSATRTSEEELKNLAFFVQDRIEFDNGVAVIPGLRHESHDIESTVIDDTYSETLFALAAEYQVTDDLLVKLSSTQIFKGPEISEVFVGAGLGETANDDIKAETGTNTELAMAYQGEALGADVFTAGATIFKTEINDFIYDYAQIPGGGPRDYWKDNVGDMTVDGFEAYVGYNRDSFSGKFTYSSAESELKAYADYTKFEGARLDRQQGDTISADFGYYFEDLDLTLNWEVMQVDDVDAGLDLDGATLDNSKDGFTVHNISVRWNSESIAGLSLIAGIDNLFDEFYASQSSRTGVSFHPRFKELYLFDYEPGRNVKATLSYQF